MASSGADVDTVSGITARQRSGRDQGCAREQEREPEQGCGGAGSLGNRPAVPAGGGDDQCMNCVINR